MLATAARPQAGAAAMLRGPGRGFGGLRVELPAPDAGDPAGRGGRHAPSERSLSEDIFSERFLIRRPLLQALEADLAGAARAADRRARPHRRAVRGLSARGAVGLPDHHPRARHDPGRAAADRDHHQQPHARDPRRAQAPLLLPLGRLPHRPSASCRSSRCACPAWRNVCRARSWPSSRSCAGATCSSCRASPRPWTGPGR